MTVEKKNALFWKLCEHHQYNNTAQYYQSLAYFVTDYNVMIFLSYERIKKKKNEWMKIKYKKMDNNSGGACLGCSAVSPHQEWWRISPAASKG